MLFLSKILINNYLFFIIKNPHQIYAELSKLIGKDLIFVDVDFFLIFLFHTFWLTSNRFTEKVILVFI